MDLTNDDLHTLLDKAKAAALAAGEIIGDNTNVLTETKIKSTGASLASQVVTEIDLAAEKAILNILTPTRATFDLGLLTEESKDDHSRFEKDFFWCIDPLDGTLFYARGESGYAVSIALVSQQGEAIIGVAYCPKSKTLYHAIKNQGAFKNNLPLKINTIPNTNQKIIDDKSAGAVKNCLATIEQAPARYEKKPKQTPGGGSIWDFAACSVIQSEAGGFNAHYDQTPLNLNPKSTTYMNQTGIHFNS